ncbi:GNAT domain-containing protein [Cercophora scortea]|uniref:GNAT domain-containing protein n=1 Tax=Cercophora scortea TaxID=314031 RepID=A0AAE0IGN5_9PEZI|nr:GNAT domain-containing protein [Cercophora scortea]
MDPVIFTPRLKLTLVTTAEKGSQDLAWYHELRSNEQSSFWNIHGTSKSLEETEKGWKADPPYPTAESPHRVSYAVHRLLSPDSADKTQTEYIGHVNLRPVSTSGDAVRALAIPENLTSLPPSAAAATVVIEVGYGFLPAAWGKGFATEAVRATIEACKAVTAREFWKPFTKVYIRAIVNGLNGASLRVLDKVGIAKRGIYGWKGEPIFHGGGWRGEADLHIYGMYLVE